MGTVLGRILAAAGFDRSHRLDLGAGPGSLGIGLAGCSCLTS